MGRWELGEWRWVVGWRRQLREWEKDWAAELLDSIRNHAPMIGRKDRWEWKGSMEGGFSVKKGYVEIEKRRVSQQLDVRCDFLFYTIWKSIAPFKAKTMVWRLAWNKLPTMDNLRKRLDIPVEGRMCCCCGEFEESCCHFFLECQAVLPLWHKILQWCGICWASPRSIRDHFLSFSEALGEGKQKLIMSSLWICVIWVFWKWRNAIKFEHNEWNHRRIEEEIKCRFWSWCVVRSEAENNYSYDMWNSRRLCDMWKKI